MAESYAKLFGNCFHGPSPIKQRENMSGKRKRKEKDKHGAVRTFS